MISLRHMALQLVDRVEGENGSHGDAALFAWELDEKETAYNDAVPIQSQIINPQDPLVRGLIAFFGERIGQPLASDFPIDMLDSLPDLLTGGLYEGQRYRLVHEWSPEAAADGGFPLTGSTFEVLAVLAKARQLEQRGDNRQIESFICFASDPAVLMSADPNAANWGQGRHLKAMQLEFANNALEMARQIQLRHEQTLQLRNFACYLKSIGQEPRFISSHRDIIDTLNTWYRQRFYGSKTISEDRAFHGLRFYDVEDHEGYFGRSDDVRRTVDAISGQLADSNSPKIHWVKGSSGVGKSSFLRAGVIAHLMNRPDPSTAIAYVVKRPNQLLTRAEAALSTSRDPLRNLFEAALDALPMLEAETLVDARQTKNLLKSYDAMQPSDQPVWAARTLDEVLIRIGAEEKVARSVRLIFGIDQFEEIVDMIDDPEFGPCWSGCLSFLLELTAGQNTFVVATIRDERIPKLQSHPDLGALWARSAHQQTLLEFPTNAGLREIVSLPFIKVGQAQLEPDLIQALVDNIMAYKKTHDASQIGSVMPLVSLMLERLHREVGQDKWQNVDKGPDRDSKDEYTSAAKGERNIKSAGSVTISKANAKGYDHLEGAISELGNRALSDANVTRNLASDTTVLDALLRRLLHWTGDAENKQFSLPAIPMPSDDGQKALAQAMLKNRLLVDEGGGLVRLVHEAVVDNWEAANAFRERERPLHEGSAKLRSFAEVWSQMDRSPDLVRPGADLLGSVALDLLALWGHRFDQLNDNLALEPVDLVVRDYCLEIMAHINDPERIVKCSQFKSTHIHIATSYRRADIVTKMLKKSPKAANIGRSDKRTPIFNTCFFCDIETLKALLRCEPDLSIPDDQGWQPLHAAAVGGDIAYYRVLEKNGATLNIETAPIHTHPMHLAAQSGKSELLDYFLNDKKIDVDLKDEFGGTALSRAISTGEAGSVRQLLQQGADRTHRSTLEYTLNVKGTPQHQAAFLGKLKVLEILLEGDRPLDPPIENGMTVLHLAALRGHHGTVQFLIQRNTELDVTATFEMDREKLKEIKPDDTDADSLRGWTALQMAVSNGHYKVVEALLKAGANPDIANAAGDCALHIAINKDNPDILRLLCGTADLSTTDSISRTPLNLAIQKNRYGLARTLVALGANPNQAMSIRGFQDIHEATLVHIAAIDKDITNLRFALALGGPPDQSDATGRLPLHYASTMGLARNVDLLLSRNPAAAGHLDANNHTPLDLACLSGDFETASIILHTINEDDIAHRLPWALHHGAIGGSVRICRLLVTEHGYDLDAPDTSGQSPLMNAIRAGQKRAAEWFIDHGSDILTPSTDRPDVTPVSLAIECRETEILNAMLKVARSGATTSSDLIKLAIEQLNFEAAASLIKWAGEPSKADAEKHYAQRMQRLDERIPHHDFRSGTLEAIFAD